MNSHHLHSIGTFYCESTERYSQPHQPQDSQSKKGMIKLEAHQNFEMALQDLNGFDKIWVIFIFHKVENWKPKVMPPRNDGSKKGVFSTRSPHRPNPIGMSCLDLIKIEGRTIYIKNHDLLNETPILDIKPYLAYCDSFPEAKLGWVNHVPDHAFDIEWSQESSLKKDWLLSKNINILELAETTLKYYPNENSHRRIKKIDINKWEFAVKTWRISYEIHKENNTILILSIYSGYDQATLNNTKPSKWDDVPIHQEFNETF